MDKVYMITGYIDNGLGGEPIMLGIFTNYELAEKELLNYIGDTKYEYEVNKTYESYSVYDKTRHFHFDLKIEPYILNNMISVDTYLPRHN